MRCTAAIRKLLACAFLVTATASFPAHAEQPPAPPRFTWVLKALPILTRVQREPIPVSVVVGPVTASNVTVLQAALVERNTRQPLAPAGMRLCRTAAADCAGQAMDLPANSSSQLWLWGGDGIGIFEGTVTLAAKERPEGDAVTMTVNSSTAGKKAWGVIAILVSVVATWLLTVWLRNRSNRKQLLLPVAIANQALGDVRIRVDAGPPAVSVPKVVLRLDDVEKQLSEPVLTANGLPSRVPGMGPATGAPTLDAYRKHVQAQSDWIQALAIIVREGLQPAWDAWSHAPDAATRQQWTGAISAMDALAVAATAPSADALRQALYNIIFAINGAGVKAMPPGAGGARDTVGTPEQLLLQIAGLGAAGWAFLLLVSTLGGAYILVLGPSGAGFGTLTDFVQCLLWGAGLPAGAQLLQSTTGSIATSFGVTR